MRKIFTAAVLAFAVIFTTGILVNTATAQDPASPGKMKQDPVRAPAETVTINGKVASVSDTSLTVVDGQKAEQTVSLGPNTKVTKGGKDVAVAELKADDSVVVVATKDENNKLTAVMITAV